MKNLLIHISPEHSFASRDWGVEADTLVKIQIDNSFNLGWKLEDVVLVTNFPYEYRGVKALVLNDDTYCDFAPTASKINAILKLFDLKLVGDDLWWFHDLDAFQLEWMSDAEVLTALGSADLGMTDYGKTTINEGRDKRWSTGTVFFKSTARDILMTLRDEIYRYRANEEIILLEILKKKRNEPYIERIKRLNITYNLATRKRDVEKAYQLADKPLRVIHFHPFDKRPLNSGKDNLAVCLRGQNQLQTQFLPQRLISVFHHYGIA